MVGLQVLVQRVAAVFQSAGAQAEECRLLLLLLHHACQLQVGCLLLPHAQECFMMLLDSPLSFAAWQPHLLSNKETPGHIDHPDESCLAPAHPTTKLMPAADVQACRQQLLAERALGSLVGVVKAALQAPASEAQATAAAAVSSRGNLPQLLACLQLLAAEIAAVPTSLEQQVQPCAAPLTPELMPGRQFA